MAWKLFELLNAIRLMIEFNAALIGVCEAILQMQSYRNGYFVNSLSFYGSCYWDNLRAMHLEKQTSVDCDLGYKERGE